MFAAYVGFVAADPAARAEIAGRLMVASVMAVPAGRSRQQGAVPATGDDDEVLN